MSAPGAQLKLGLSGNGVSTPTCSSTVCRNATLEPNTALCVLSPGPDGTACTACTDGCVQGTCVNGSCIGNLVSCDDADPCTADSCALGVGCVRAPVTCQASNPCSAASCSPDAGCTESTVIDGTACGPADCVTARICISGACVTRAVPDGAGCGLEPAGASAELREIDARGELRMQCPLNIDTQRRPGSMPILGQGGTWGMLTGRGPDRLEPRIEVWKLPGYSPASKGWVSPRGGPGLELRER